ncbi:unnamed protein product [Bursaphelenchus xylophilus]|uniref:(pine wood nematode) hypothetical protein n=1 Tax=Bursaphelenchus xylophilus TaxID=6326 RepID=A0A1I7SDR2_BURXY|nr:unnamed protein product [Bursaphelenchus xylophilus]CAG9084399.1 unnamed protein product [Bursaphelenchus xylophilus]
MSMISTVEDLIWGKVDETEYLRKVVEDDNVDLDALSQKVRSIQSDLHIQLRKGVEENYPKLLEQVGAIETLDRVQSGFNEEMRMVDDKAKQVKHFFAQSYDHLRSDCDAMENLVLFSRVISDTLRCQELIRIWEKEERDMLTKAECANELKALCLENTIFASVPWINNGFLKKVTVICAQTSSEAVEELKQSLSTLNVSHVNTCLKAFSYLFDHDGCTKELRAIMDESLQSIDLLFMNLLSAKTSDGVSRQLSRIGNNLHTYLERFHVLGAENALYFSNKVATILRNRMPVETEYMMRLVQTVSKCLLPHAEAIVKPIRDALGPLKTAILSQSLARLFELVNDTFSQEDLKGPVIVEKLNGAIKSEINSFSWDNELQKQVEGNVAKTLQIIAAKIEEQIIVNPEVLRLSGRVSKAQAANYQLLSVAYAFRKQWPLYSDCIRAFIDPQLRLIVDTMKETIILVLDSMHEEDLNRELQQSPCSLYMGELCDHLKVFRTHINHIEPLAESLETLPNFINFIIEQFLLNSTLTTTFAPLVRTRLVKDFGALCKMLQSLNCNSSKFLNNRNLLSQLLNSEEIDYNYDVKQIPCWFITQLGIRIANLQLPYESADWTRKEYINWFNSQVDLDRMQFLLNVVKIYENSGKAKNEKVERLKDFIVTTIATLNAP